MTHVFATHFERVVAIDVSEEMLKRAQAIVQETSNITWLHSNGENLSGVANGSADLVFSYLVLQHLPQEDLVTGYISEMLRVLRRGGLCLFQFNGYRRPDYELEGTSGLELA